MLGTVVVTTFTANEVEASSSSAVQVTQQQTNATESYQVVSGDSLSVIAARFSTTVDQIKTDNHLVGDIIYVDQILTLPSLTHQVQSDDSLSALAKRYDVTVDAIASANNLTSDIIQIGQQLKIPVENGSETPTSPVNQRESKIYHVKSGDTLSAIAMQFDTTVAELKNINHLSSDIIQIGQKLTIIAPARSEPYTVSAGDNVWDLSVQYGLPQNELLTANNLTTTSSLSIGQELKIPVHHIAVQTTVSEGHGEHLDWWT